MEDGQAWQRANDVRISPTYQKCTILFKVLQDGVSGLLIIIGRQSRCSKHFSWPVHRVDPITASMVFKQHFLMPKTALQAPKSSDCKNLIQECRRVILKNRGPTPAPIHSQPYSTHIVRRIMPLISAYISLKSLHASPVPSPFIQKPRCLVIQLIQQRHHRPLRLCYCPRFRSNGLSKFGTPFSMGNKTALCSHAGLSPDFKIPAVARAPIEVRVSGIFESDV